jgi:hypothetical protein
MMADRGTQSLASRPAAPAPRASSRAAEKRDKLAPLHVALLSWQLAQQLLRNAYDVVFTVI